jgi:hypothetical protein
MTTDQEHLALRNRLQDVLGADEATTLWAMLRTHDDLATKYDLSSTIDELRAELKAEIVATRTELKAEITGIRADLHGFIRTFIAVQAGTVVGVAGIFYGLIRLT